MTRALDIKNYALAALRSGMTTVPAARIYSSHLVPFEREDLPAISLRLGESQSQYETLDTVEHQLDLEFDIEVRGAAPDDIAEPIRAEIGALLFADPTFGGLCLWIRPGQTSRELNDADQDAGKTTEKIIAIYRLPPGQI